MNLHPRDVVRAGDGEHFVGHQRFGVEVDVVAQAETDADVDPLAGEIELDRCRQEVDLDAGRLGNETVDPRRQPARSERGEGLRVVVQALDRGVRLQVARPATWSERWQAAWRCRVGACPKPDGEVVV